MGHRWLFAIAIFTLAMAFIFATSAFSLPPGNAAIPASLSFTAMAMLSVAAGFSLKRQTDRITSLERRLSAAGIPA